MRASRFHVDHNSVTFRVKNLVPANRSSPCLYSLSLMSAVLDMLSLTFGWFLLLNPTCLLWDCDVYMLSRALCLWPLVLYLTVLVPRGVGFRLPDGASIAVLDCCFLEEEGFRCASVAVNGVCLWSRGFRCLLGHPPWLCLRRGRALREMFPSHPGPNPSYIPLKSNPMTCLQKLECSLSITSYNTTWD